MFTDDCGARPILQIYLHELEKTPLLSAEEEKEIIVKVFGGDMVARDQLIRANLRLVVFEAKRYFHISGPTGFIDIIQAGNVGLIHAVDRVNPGYDNRFSTYAASWIKQQIWSALRKQGNLVLLPPKLLSLLLRLMRSERKLRGVLCREPSLEEIRADAHVSLEDQRLLAGAEHPELSLAMPVGSLDFGFRETLGDRLPDEDSLSSYARYDSRVFSSALSAALKKLTDREREILLLRHGLLGDESCTLQEIGDRFGVTREAIRRSEERALAKLRKFFEREFDLAC